MMGGNLDLDALSTFLANEYNYFQSTGNSCMFYPPSGPARYTIVIKDDFPLGCSQAIIDTVLMKWPYP